MTVADHHHLSGSKEFIVNNINKILPTEIDTILLVSARWGGEVNKYLDLLFSSISPGWMVK